MSNNSAIKASFGYTLSNFLVKGAVFLSIPLFTRIMTTTDYGYYNTYHSYEMILAPFVSIALYMSLKNANIKFKDQYNSYVSSLLLLMLISFVIWQLVLGVFSNCLSHLEGISRFILFAMVIHCFCSSIVTLYNVHLSIKYLFKSYIIVALFNTIVSICLSVFLMLFILPDNKYYARVLGTIVPLGLIAIYLFYFFWSKCAPTINFLYWKFALKFSLPLIPHALSQIVLNQFDRVMILSLVNASSSGIYSFAYNVYFSVEVIKQSLDSVWSTWFYKHLNANDISSIRQVSREYIIFMFFVVSFVISFSPEILSLIAPSEYSDANYIISPLSVAGFFSFLYTLPAHVEYYYAKTFYISIGTSLAAVVNVILNYIFITKYGYFMAAYTTEITYILYFIGHYCISRRIHNVSLFPLPLIVLTSFVLVLYSILSTCFLHCIIVRWLMGLIVLLIVFFHFKSHLVTFLKRFFRYEN